MDAPTKTRPTLDDIAQVIELIAGHACRYVRERTLEFA